MDTETRFDYREYWEDGLTWEEYLEESVEENEELWRGVHRRHHTPDRAVERARRLEEPRRLLVIAEDWCGDASNTVPVLARLAQKVPELEVRIVERDENPELMDRHLTDGSRSIPIAVVLDSEFHAVGSWGPRPAELQEFVIAEKERGERPVSEIYRDARRWYAEDAGETTLEELLEVLEATAPVAG